MGDKEKCEKRRVRAQLRKIDFTKSCKDARNGARKEKETKFEKDIDSLEDTINSNKFADVNVKNV